MAVYNQSRSNTIRLIVIITFVVIALQLFYLQIVDRRYEQLAMDNAVYPKVIYPERGIIYDRKGKAILNNTIIFDLMVTPAEAKGIDTLDFCRLMNMDTSEFRKRMVDAILKNTSVRPSVFKAMLTKELQARFEENSWRFPGFNLVERDYIGKTGLEAYYESVLMGQRGVQYMIKDNKNRLVGTYEGGEYDTAAVAGRSLRTHIDIELQQLAEALMNNKVGGLVAIDPKTGGILSMVSGPNYDPNDLSGPDGSKNFSRMQLDVSGPMLNRAGRYTLCGHGKPECTHAGGGHAANVRLAIANSCNAYFAHIYRLTVDNPRYKNVYEGYLHWKEYMNAFGLGVRLGVDLPNENTGGIPDTVVYNRENAGRWTSCTNLTLGIGQDKMQTTPLQMANAMCVIANKGYYYTPHFVKGIEGEGDDDEALLNRFQQKHDVLTNIPDIVFNEVIEGMSDVVKVGTARGAQIEGVEVCAKTGTAENYTILDRRRIKLPDNSMFVCFAPKENPKIAIAVFVQNAGFGATWAAPIARMMMEKYLLDTLTAKSKIDSARIASTNLMPSYFKRLQYKEDSIRAFKWFQVTKDSTYIDRFSLQEPARGPRSPFRKTPTEPELPNWVKILSATSLPERGIEKLKTFSA